MKIASTISQTVNPPAALTIAGSDNSAGAGAQADLKTFSAYGVYGLTAITCVVAEIPGKVSAIAPVEPSIVGEQIRLSLDAFPVAAVKTGMLFSREIIEIVASVIRHLRPPEGDVPLVIDPVMVASSGDPLLEPDAVDAYRRLLFPMATVLTPNLDELASLVGRAIGDLESLREAGRVLAEITDVPVLAKGGHLKGDMAVDFLVEPGGKTHELVAPYEKGVSPHGTGCTYASAIAAGLAKGMTLVAAAGAAKEYITRTIRMRCVWSVADDGMGKETVCLNHRV